MIFGEHIVDENVGDAWENVYVSDVTGRVFLDWEDDDYGSSELRVEFEGEYFGEDGEYFDYDTIYGELTFYMALYSYDSYETFEVCYVKMDGDIVDFKDSKSFTYLFSHIFDYACKSFADKTDFGYGRSSTTYDEAKWILDHDGDCMG